ncbi:type I-E CRISPR-associated protein Cas6/Cse3/CasE [Streptomonospora sp. S1-112]|uniref:Type I-E CRISPR-associated protein Cas6/Cse3/CasE n=1 Tax=Streptomonospora mangrovi TaxID=2883123 RepID=A0A9X3NLS4_9ACTN|nr:type I-E CRISPR-associated protein Cas6/Cse3/CasE [Streptomonospora mangrovi]MDA0564159.1 type I-E CRISPR-associated protein Cas6/Cse3/CasE [Streptomonospora mangrovi]
MKAWLTRIALNHRHPGVHALVGDANLLHRELMRLAPDDLGEHPRQAAGLLYRLETGPSGVHILAQTTLEPRTDRLTGGLAASVAVRELTPLLDALTAGARVRYRITANPTQRVGNSTDNPARKGKLTVVFGQRGELWWLERATGLGLHPLSVDQTRLADIRVGAVRHAATRFEGTGVVTDPQALRGAVIEGIGRAKSYGCGLLSLGLDRTAGGTP